MRIGWTACGLIWCLGVVASTTIDPPSSSDHEHETCIGARPSSSRAQHRRISQRQAEAEGTASEGESTNQPLESEAGPVVDPESSGSSVIPPPSSSSTSDVDSSSAVGSPSSPSAPPTPSMTDTGTDGRRTLPQPPNPIPSSPPSPAPSPMDLTVSYSLSNDCLLFISTFLTSSLFRSCLPFSLLLTTSTSYSTLVNQSPNDSYNTLNNLVGYTSSPQPSSGQCDDYFAGLTKSFGEKKHCAVDVGEGERDPAAVDVRNGLGNYKVMREAAGLRDPDSGEYCYLQAVADERPDDMYLWSIPANIPVPRTAKPTCSKCSALLLNHLSTSLSSPSALNKTIIRSAADTVNAACGSTFVTFNNAALANSAPCPVGVLANDRVVMGVLVGIVAILPVVLGLGL